MKKCALCVLCLWTASVAVVHAAAGVDFAHYQVILDRQPFGKPPPPPPPPPANPTPPPPPVRTGPVWAERVRVCGISESGGEMRVAFIDNGGQPPQNFYLAVGGAKDGFKVVDVRYGQGAALIDKNGEPYWVFMDGHYSADAPGDGDGARKDVARTAPAAAPAPTAPAAPLPAVAEPAAAPPEQAAPQPRSAAIRAHAPGLGEQLRARRQALSERQSEPPAAKIKPDELEQHLRKYNLELIRAGGKKGPPLPIALSKEEDDQLVEEGVLEAQEAKE